jgi:hypothetical protein
MVYVNTLMLPRVLGEPTWLERMGANERRALTPLFWGHVRLEPQPRDRRRLALTGWRPIGDGTPRRCGAPAAG